MSGCPSRVLRIAASIGIIVLALTACSSSGSGKADTPPAQPNPAPAATTGAKAGDSGPASLEESKYFGLTKLDKPKLCGVMSTSEATGILGKATAAPEFTDTLGLGIVCEWRAGSVDDELYIGVSTVIDWKGARAVAQLVHPTDLTIDGHPALGAAPQGPIDYALVDVAVGADHDPAIEFRAPTLAKAQSLASLVTPKLLALAG